MDITLPFTTNQFFDVFRQYNTAIWPLQILLILVAITVAVLSARGRSGRLVPLYLAVQWTWTAVVYHWLFFARINAAARVFGALWIAGALAFAWNGIAARGLSYRTEHPARTIVGGALIVYALIVYPLFGYFDGRVYPFAPTYGAPCPVTILTLGLLWLAKAPVPRYLLIAPVLWAAVGSSAAFTLGVREDMGLLVAGLSGVVLLLRSGRSRRAEVTPTVRSPSV